MTSTTAPDPDDSDGLADDPENYGGLSIEDDPGGTVDPADVAGTASRDDDTVSYAPEHSEAEDRDAEG